MCDRCALYLADPKSPAAFDAMAMAKLIELADSTLFGLERGSFTGADRLRQGLVERVGQGTRFLDEVGELSPPTQVKLLRLLQERPLSVSAATAAFHFEGAWWRPPTERTT